MSEEKKKTNWGEIATVGLAIMFGFFAFFMVIGMAGVIDNNFKEVEKELRQNRGALVQSTYATWLSTRSGEDYAKIQNNFTYMMNSQLHCIPQNNVSRIAVTREGFEMLYDYGGKGILVVYNLSGDSLFCGRDNYRTDCGVICPFDLEISSKAFLDKYKELRFFSFDTGSMCKFTPFEMDASDKTDENDTSIRITRTVQEENFIRVDRFYDCEYAGLNPSTNQNYRLKFRCDSLNNVCGLNATLTEQEA